MKGRKGMRKGAWLIGALAFFLLVAAIIQIAVLIFDYIEARTQNNGLIAVLMLVVILLLAAICTFVDYIRRRLTVDKPVEKILTATERIAQGDFSTRLESIHPYGKYDQYDLIMENLNLMAAELSKTEVLKTDFISNVSHELKTPLTVIKSYATLLQKENLAEEKREEYAQAVVAAAEKLNGLITNILRLNKLENQEMKPEYEAFDLADALAEAALAFEGRLEDKQIDFSCDLEENVRVYSSKSYLDIVWNNLLSNAIKFTAEGGSVALTMKKTGDKVSVCVSDNGKGISVEEGAKIFEKFYQGDTSHAEEGNGLGLPLVKKVVDILGGEIAVESEEGKGSSFTVTLRV